MAVVGQGWWHLEIVSSRERLLDPEAGAAGPQRVKVTLQIWILRRKRCDCH